MLNGFFYATLASSKNFILEISGSGDFVSYKCQYISAKI